MNITFTTWLILVTLSVVSYAAHASTWGRGATIAIVVIALIKCGLVGFRFMELRKAHPAWKTVFVTLIGAFSIFLLIMA